MICHDCIYFKRKPNPTNESRYYQVNGSNEIHEMVYGTCMKPEYGIVTLKTHYNWGQHECAMWPRMYDIRAVEFCSRWMTNRFTIEE